MALGVTSGREMELFEFSVLTPRPPTNAAALSALWFMIRAPVRVSAGPDDGRTV
jgi:hypothetical protein